MTIGAFHLTVERDVLLEPRVGAVHDLVDRERRRGLFGMRAVVRGERLGDFVQPFVELGDRPRVERGKRADDSRLALRDHQRRVRDDEQRRADDRQRERPCRTLGTADMGRYIPKYCYV